jgi:type VI secretion system secreted protein Hcp
MATQAALATQTFLQQEDTSKQDFYVQLEGINGESKDANHKDWIEALSFSYGVSQSASLFTGGGGGVGKASFDVFSFEHYVDKATPNLLKYCAAGKHVPKVVIAACKVGDGSQEYLRITLLDVLVVRAGPTGSTADARLKEEVHLSYARIEVEVREQKSDGSLGPTVTGTWDVKQNKA